MDAQRFNLSRTSPARPQRVVIYGPPGCGKTTFASCWPRPVLIDIEHGADQIRSMATIGTPSTAVEAKDMLAWLAEYGPSQGAQTVVLDSIDALEPMIAADVCSENGKLSIEAFDYGRGYILMNERLVQLLKAADACILSGLEVVIIGHATEATVHDPTGADYTRRTIALQRRLAETLTRWADAVLYLDISKIVRVEQRGKTGKAVGSGRVIHTAQRASALAKSRRPLPDTIEIGDDRTYSAFFAAWRQ